MPPHGSPLFGAARLRPRCRLGMTHSCPLCPLCLLFCRTTFVLLSWPTSRSASQEGRRSSASMNSCRQGGERGLRHSARWARGGVTSCSAHSRAPAASPAASALAALHWRASCLPAIAAALACPFHRLRRRHRSSLHPPPPLPHGPPTPNLIPPPHPSPRPWMRTRRAMWWSGGRCLRRTESSTRVGGGVRGGPGVCVCVCEQTAGPPTLPRRFCVRVCGVWGVGWGGGGRCSGQDACPRTHHAALCLPAHTSRTCLQGCHKRLAKEQTPHATLPWPLPLPLPLPAGDFAEAIRDQFLQERVEFFK